jgi:hypothetical protein
MEQKLSKTYLRKKQKEKLGERYEELKKEMVAAKDQETLAKYKILNEAMKIGKKMHRTFSELQLASDFEIGLTTVKRLLSLNRASDKTWEHIKSGKISAFKVSQICSTKNRHFQEEIVEKVIDQELSTYDIKHIRVNNIEDLNKYRFEKAIKEGYSRKNSAYKNFENAILRMKLFMSMDIVHFPRKTLPEIESRLKELNQTINLYIKKKLKKGDGKKRVSQRKEV